MKREEEEGENEKSSIPILGLASCMSAAEKGSAETSSVRRPV
jgi:hypothetical protein